MFRATRLALCMTLSLVITAGAAQAHIGSVMRISNTVDDATVQLSHTRPVIYNDGRTYCRVRVIVEGGQVPISAGDTIEIRVWEDEGLLGINDTIFRRLTVVTADEVRAQRVDRTFNCSGRMNPVDEDEAELDIGARAVVTKRECGFLCVYDRPTASSDFRTARHLADRFESHEVDGNRMVRDDSREGAVLLERGTVRDLSAIDADWKRIVLNQPSVIDLSLNALVDEGRVDMRLTNDQGRSIVRAEQNDAGASLTSDLLQPGTYYVAIEPLVESDYSFYSITLDVTENPRDCEDGAMEGRDCGNCGRQVRSCQADGAWAPWGACQNEGVCAPGASLDAACGRCGVETATCTAACDWAVGECANQGVCEPGAVDSEACGQDGNRARTCDDMCAWGDFGECITCEDDAEQVCYSGPDAVIGVGSCVPGMQRCSEGQWTACEGEVLPEEEICGNGVDNDCDGVADADEETCQPQCGNGAIEGDEQCDEISQDCVDCEVGATDISEGGAFLGSYQEGSFDRFSFTLDVRTDVTLRVTDPNANCDVAADMSLTGGGDPIAPGDNMGCPEITVTLDAGAYELRVSGPNGGGLRDYRLESEFDASEPAPDGGVMPRPDAAMMPTADGGVMMADMATQPAPDMGDPIPVDTGVRPMPDGGTAPMADMGPMPATDAGGMMAGDGAPPRKGGTSSGGGGCLAASTAHAPVWLLLLFLGLGIRRRFGTGR